MKDLDASCKDRSPVYYKTGMTKITQGFSAKYRALTPKYINNSQASEAER